MVCYIESRITDPYYNLALEQFVFDSLPRENSYFMLWQNDNSVIIGKHQNTGEEINAGFVRERGIVVARRLSGGGAVYHDLGNLNFTFICNAGEASSGGDASTGSAESRGETVFTGMDFSFFCKPICEALRLMGVPAEISGRNDMTVEGRKFSGNAQYIKQGRVMHHGTLLFDSDLTVLSGALNPGEEKLARAGVIESRAIKSVQSRVTNIRPYLKTDMSIEGFWAALKNHIAGSGFTGSGMEDYVLSPAQTAEVENLRERVYSQWSWNYGSSPPHTMRKAARVEGCGKIEVLLDIGREGIIKNIAFYGDFFSSLDVTELSDLLTGRKFEYSEIRSLLGGIDVSQYFRSLKKEDFLDILFHI